MKKTLSLLVMLLSLTATIFAQDTIKVAIKESAPFTMKKDGEWKGISIDLLNRIKSKTDYHYDFIEINDSYDKIISDVNTGEYDLFAGSPTITGDRLNKVDFTQPFFVGSISVATNIDTDIGFWRSLFTWKFLKNVGGLMLIILFCGILFWFFEKDVNDNIDSGWKGIFDGAYFASFTMTTVGYTDTVTSKAGKVMSFVLMWISIGLVGVICGNISASLTVSELDNGITEVSEMKKLKVGSIYGTTSTDFLDKQDVKYIGYTSVVEGLDAIQAGELDVFVYDTPILQYMTGKEKYGDIQVIPQSFSEETYGLCTPKGSSIIGKINPIIVNYVNSDDWDELLIKYNLN